MAAYKNIPPRGTDADFSKIESRDISQSRNQNLASTYFFLGDIHFTTRLTRLHIQLNLLVPVMHSLYSTTVIGFFCFNLKYS